jgi:hypothetical protein
MNVEEMLVDVLHTAAVCNDWERGQERERIKESGAEDDRVDATLHTTISKPDSSPMISW